MIQKATELGVTRFIPILTDRTVVRKINEKRIKKIIIEACEQSNRLIIQPSISINLLSDHNKIFIKIIDNGIGISQEMVNKIFEPYFTTKNKGTGLGLSIVKKIIEDHNGKIRIEKNKQMAGTTSSIIFENINV